MNKFIVTTTIYAPSHATLAYISKKDWTIIIVGDKKTPHDLYKKLAAENENLIYLTPEFQQEKYERLSDSIGWNCIQRRNIGFVEAYKLGADIIASVDDDNIPYSTWGNDLLISPDGTNEYELDCYTTDSIAFDPLSVTNNNILWHRGYPIELVNSKNSVNYVGPRRIKPLVQASLWDGNPDIDAICRMLHNQRVKFSDISPYWSTSISPFNSQNTFISRCAIKDYCVIPFIGRMDDIWASYIFQLKHPNSIIYTRASVYQERNVHNNIVDLKNELIGYEHTYDMLKCLSYMGYLPEKSINFLECYQAAYE